MIRVLVADDQELLRSGFSMVLGAAPDIEVVGQARDGADAVRLAGEQRPDVVLMDIRMPVMDGLEATRRIVASDGSCRIIVLTTFDLDEYAFEAVRAGASGFLLKDVPSEELLRAVRVVSAGDAVLAPRVTQVLMRHVAATRDHRSGAPSGPDLRALTPRERELLVFLGRGQSNAEIARELVLSEATVKTHVSRILMKLGLRDRAQAVVVAYEAGVVSPGDGGPVG